MNPFFLKKNNIHIESKLMLQKEVLLPQSGEDIAVQEAVAQYLNTDIEGRILKSRQIQSFI